MVIFHSYVNVYQRVKSKCLEDLVRQVASISAVPRDIARQSCPADRTSAIQDFSVGHTAASFTAITFNIVLINV